MTTPSKVQKLDVAITRIICDHPFFASLLLQHPIVADDNIPTACVNQFGEIRYNAVWFESMEIPEIVFVLCHECMHYMYMHCVRRFNRDPMQWNIACDAVINETLMASKVGRMPSEGITLDGAEHKTAEQVYGDMPKQPPQQPPPGADGPTGGQGGQPPPSSTNNNGGPVDPNAQPQGDHESIGNDLDETGAQMPQAEASALEEEVKQRVLQARNAAKQTGNMPALLDAFVDALIDTTMPWFEVMRPHFASLALNDYSYDRVDRRFIHAGIYMPAEWGKGAGVVACIADESGSIRQNELDQIASEINKICEDTEPDKVAVIHCASQTHDIVDEFTPDDYPIEFKARMSGGTDMTKGIERAVADYPESELIIVFTDGYTPFGDEDIAQGIPVIWAITSSVVAPWGTTIHVDLNS